MQIASAYLELEQERVSERYYRQALRGAMLLGWTEPIAYAYAGLAMCSAGQGRSA